MNLVIYVILALLLLITAGLIILLASLVTVELSCIKKNGEEARLSLIISFLSGRIKKEIALDKKKAVRAEKEAATDAKKIEENKAFKDKVKLWYGVFCDFISAYRLHRYRIRKSIVAKKIELTIGFGTSDAADTGIITGALWAGIYNVVAFISRIITIAEPKISITPDFSNERLEVQAHCIIKARVVHLISIGLMTGFSFYRFQKKRNRKYS